MIAFCARLRVLPGHLLSDPASEFVRELVFELDSVFPAQHILFDEHALAEHLVSCLATELNMSASARNDTRVIVEDSLRRRGRLSDDAWQRLDLREVSPRLRPAEAGSDFVLHVPASLLDHIEPSLPRAAAFDAATRACDDADSLADFFDALARGKATLGALFDNDADVRARA